MDFVFVGVAAGCFLSFFIFLFIHAYTIGMLLVPIKIGRIVIEFFKKGEIYKKYKKIKIRQMRRAIAIKKALAELDDELEGGY